MPVWRRLLRQFKPLVIWILVVAAACWNQISYNFVFFLAGLQSIPKSLIEAAAIDGAGPSRRFWTVIFPLLSPTGFFLLVVNTIYALLGTFGIIDSLTKGGPGKDTEILVFKVYNDGFRAQDQSTGDTAADESRQPLRAAAAGNETELHLGQAKLRFDGRDAEIAG